MGISDIDDDDDVVLRGRLNDGKSLLDALKCLEHGRMKDVEVSAHPSNGVRFSTVIPGSMLSSVSIPSRSFADYYSTTIRISLALSSLTDCLALPATDRPYSASLQLTSDTLSVSLVEELGACTECSLRTQEGVIAALDGMRSAPVTPTVASAVIKSEVLREAINELDYGGAEVACLAMSPDVPRMVLCSPQPPRRNVHVQFPDPTDPGQDCFDDFQCKHAIRACFRIDFLTALVKSLSVSDTAKLKVNQMGSLSIVCKSSTSGYFHETLIIPQEVDDDEDMDRDEDDQHDDMYE